MKLYNHLKMIFTRVCLCLPTLLSEKIENSEESLCMTASRNLK